MNSKRFPKCKIEKELSPRGFTRWVQPEMEKYHLECCDCGLVHEMQFRVVGTRKMKVQLRARRALKYTTVSRIRKGAVSNQSVGEMLSVAFNNGLRKKLQGKKK